MANASSSSAGEETSRIPRPPPPAAALSRIGKPTPGASSRACASVVALSVPGTSGTPAACIAAFACTLSPICAITSASGPMKTRSFSVHARTKAGRSARNPYPGCTAWQPVVSAAATIEAMFR